MNSHSRKQSSSRYSLNRLVFSFALPIVLLLAFLARQCLDFNDIGLSNGFSHPLSGWDHLVTMLAVGIWAAQLRGRAIWMLPLAFVSVMSLGGLAGAAGLHIPNVDGIILISCAVFSVLITRKIRFNNKINVLIVGFFAFFHGFAHGQEISTSASLISYTLGFMLATLLLHGAGILVAKLVVFIFSCLLTLLFSNSVLAKTAETFIVDQATSPVVFQINNADFSVSHSNPQQKQDSYSLASLTSDKLNPYSNGLNNVYLDDGDGGLANIPKYYNQISNSANCQNLCQHAKYFSNSAIAVEKIKSDLHPISENTQTGKVEFSYSADCSNLDFKNYYPKINHTPGRDFLSNGVGLTSPPVYCPANDLPLLYPISALPLIEASSLLQFSFSQFHFVDSVSKSIGLANSIDLNLAIQTSSLHLFSIGCSKNFINFYFPLFSNFNISNFSILSNRLKLNSLSINSKYLLYSILSSAAQSFFHTSHQILNISNNLIHQEWM